MYEAVYVVVAVAQNVIEGERRRNDAVYYYILLFGDDCVQAQAWCHLH